MKTLIVLFSLLMIAPKSVYEFKVNSIDGKALNLQKYKGKKIMIVNTASKCGYTPQYADLEKLAAQYKDKLVVICVPANNFGSQEPGTNAEIQQFCKNYGTSFVLLEKESVKGFDISPLFQYLTTAENADFIGEIKWNFEKFLLDENGKLIHRFRSATTPMSADITKYL